MKTKLLFAVILFASVSGKVFAQEALTMNYTGDTSDAVRSCKIEPRFLEKYN